MLPMHLLDEVISALAQGMALPEANRDHALAGNYKDCRECHISPDWLLIYQMDDDVVVLTLLRTGSHSDLFN
jgi:mRNA interferase YafQ